VSAWGPARPDPACFKPEPGLTSRERAAEQDRAAGGRDKRVVQRPDGPAVVASVALRLPAKRRRIYAYLRWAAPDRVTRERYIGDVSAAVDRQEALRIAWSMAHNDVRAIQDRQPQGEPA